MNKDSGKAGFSFGIGMTIFFLFQNFIVNDNQTNVQIMKSIASALVAGALSGILFGWLTGVGKKFGSSGKRKDANEESDN